MVGLVLMRKDEPLELLDNEIQKLKEEIRLNKKNKVSKRKNRNNAQNNYN